MVTLANMFERIISKNRVIAWNVGFILVQKRNILQMETVNILWLKHSYRDRFFADPFVLDYNDEQIRVLAEEYLYSTKKGHIVLLEINRKDYRLVRKVDFLDTDYHLSFPFVFQNEIIPEQYKSGQLYAYSIDGQIERRVSDLPLIDVTVYDYDGMKYLFASKIMNEKEDAKKTLFRYRLNDNNEVVKETEVLVKNDYFNSRNAGQFFTIDGVQYRPGQNSSYSEYGESICINKVIENNEQSYIEMQVKKVTSHNSKRYNKGLHTFNVYEEFTVVDGYEVQFHPILNFRWKIERIMRHMMRKD